MNNKPIQLTEQDLHMLVEDAVMTYLIQEGFFGNLWNGVKNVAGGAWDKMKQAGNTAGALYYNGAANGQIKKLQQMRQQHEEKIEQIERQIEQLQQQAQNKQQAAQANKQNFQNRMTPNTTYNQPQGNANPNMQGNANPNMQGNVNPNMNQQQQQLAN